MRLGIRSKVFLITFALIAVSVMAAEAYLSTALDAFLTERVRDDLLVRLSFVQRDAEAFSAAPDDIASWDRLADALGQRGRGRVTIFGTDGRVLGDSDLNPDEVRRAQNHADRPEIARALSGAQGTSTRWSDTVKQRMMYVAIPVRNSAVGAVGAVRLAKPLTEVDDALAQLHRFLGTSSIIALALGMLLVAFSSHLIARRVRWLTEAARQMAAGNLDVRLHPKGHDEIASLGQALDHLAEGLRSALSTLRRERDLMGTVLEGMREGVLLLDGSGNVALANAAFRSILLLGPDIVGKSLLELVRNTALKHLVDQAMSASEAVSGELEIGDIRPRQLLVNAVPLRSESKGVLAVFVDVTELRRLETVRRDFVANVSHELRTPVAAVRSAAETLRRVVETQPDVALEFLDMIARNAERLQQLIDDLLDLSRIEAREYKLSIEPISLQGATESLVSMFQPQATAKKISLAAVIASGTPRVLADRRALDQVLTNFVDNAIKYCPSGATVIIRTELTGPGIRVLVEDTGPGIEAKHLPRLFERFYRVDNGRSRDLGGTGLGLSIVKHLVEAMQGAVRVESTPGKGSVFSFVLPVA